MGPLTERLKLPTLTYRSLLAPREGNFVKAHSCRVYKEQANLGESRSLANPRPRPRPGRNHGVAGVLYVWRRTSLSTLKSKNQKTAKKKSSPTTKRQPGRVASSGPVSRISTLQTDVWAAVHPGPAGGWPNVCCMFYT